MQPRPARVVMESKPSKDCHSLLVENRLARGRDWACVQQLHRDAAAARWVGPAQEALSAQLRHSAAASVIWR